MRSLILSDPLSSARRCIFLTLWMWQQRHHQLTVAVCTLILVSSMCNMNAVEALAATASRSFGGDGSGFGGGGGANTNKSKKQNRNKKQRQQQLQPLYIPDTSATTQELVSFCKNVMEFEGIEGTEIGFSTKTRLRGLYATDNFSAGEFILGIPFVGCLTLARDEMSAKDEADDAELGYRLLQRINNDNKQQEQAQSWNPYFQSLPCMKQEQTHFDATPDFFTLDELQALECPILIQKATTRKQQIQQLAAQLLLEEEKTVGNDHSFEVVDEHQLQFATWLVKSRGLTLLKPVRRGSSSSSSNTETSTVDDDDDNHDVLSKTVLIPYMDMINHSHNPNCELVAVETKAEEESFYALQALRPIVKGKEITITYVVGGKQQQQQQQQQQQGCDISSMIELFANYGFISPLPPPAASLAQRDLFTWTTTLKEDEQLLNELETTKFQDMPMQSNMRKVLEFRIHMKRAQQHNNK